METRFCRKHPLARVMTFVVPFCIFLLVVSLTSVWAETDRPSNPIVDYVPQNIGMYDTYFSEFQTVDCRWCHGDRNAVAQRHQLTASAFASCPDGCQLSSPSCLEACHPDPENPETITSECVTADCHPTGSGGRHHQIDLSGSRQCTACHRPDLLVETGSVKPPSYFPTPYTKTPTPRSCENCHWPTNCDEVLPDRIDQQGSTDDVGRVVTSMSPDCADDDALFELDWSTWPHPDPLAPPAFIAASGYMQFFSLNPDKSYMPSTGTHHEVGLGLELS